jgi:predicted nucleotide-binding protein (sugar kinase/HSP70/actin superfamily)
MTVIEPAFTREMRETHTILAPNMATIQFRILVHVLKDEGYSVKLLENEGPQVVRKGLKYVHNDTCYPALLVIGQMIDALDSGEYDLNKTALAITQTGGGCRASNYIHLLRKAVDKAGYTHIPIVSLNLKGMNKNSGFKITIRMLRKGIAALVCGDTLMLLRNQVRPYEVHHGDTQILVDQWIARLSDQYRQGDGYTKRAMARDLRAMVEDFSRVEVDYDRPVVKVGIVGEIYMKYAPLGNNHLEDFLASQSCEVMIPGVLGFILYGLQNQLEDIKLYGGSTIRYAVMHQITRYIAELEDIMIHEVGRVPRFTPPVPFKKTIESAKEVISLGCKMGEGWLLTAEMRDLAEMGYQNIICVQPFGCLPNHIVGKGMIRRLKELDEQINIVPVDYDPGATRVNQENRIKLMLAVANEHRIEQLEKQRNEQHNQR